MLSSSGKFNTKQIPICLIRTIKERDPVAPLVCMISGLKLNGLNIPDMLRVLSDRAV